MREEGRDGPRDNIAHLTGSADAWYWLWFCLVSTGFQTHVLAPM